MAPRHSQWLSRVSICWPCVFRLDPALIRPGRVDRKDCIDLCSAFQLQQMFTRFYPDEPEDRAAEFAAKMLQEVGRVSAAHVQGLLMLRKDDARAAIDDVAGITKL